MSGEMSIMGGEASSLVNELYFHVSCINRRDNEDHLLLEALTKKKVQKEAIDKCLVRNKNVHHFP